jgi:AraC-like DNA-binding protein
LRIGLAIAAALYIAALNLADFVPDPLGGIAVPGSLIKALVMAALVFVFAVLLLSPARGEPAAAASGPISAAPPGPATPPPAAPGDAQEASWLDALRVLMDVHKIYREEGFGIALLASRLGLPEYRLRRLINQRLGHRNFTDFVNLYRLAEAMAALSDPGQAQVPILTIALDAGFQSIGPFNRAFKAHAGLTPSEFRRRELGRLDPRAAD